VTADESHGSGHEAALQPPLSPPAADASLSVSPASLRIEASTICQLRCPQCPTTRGETAAAIGSGHLTLERFRRIAGGTVTHVELSNWGEIFLNPHLVDILAYAQRHDIRLTADNGTNLNHLAGEVAEALVEFAFFRITCSIDGASQETYAVYRRGGSLARVLRNIEKINDAKSRRGTSLPALRWQFVVFGHNEHEIPAARALARDLGMEIQFKLNWAEDYSPVRDPELVKRLTGLPAASRSEYHALTRQRYRQKLCCAQLWNMPAINWDGRVLGCSVNRWGDFGAVETSLAEALNSENMRYARRMLLGEAAARADIPCFRCHNYRYMAGTGDWMTLEQIESAGQELPIPPAGAPARSGVRQR
jgi:MoaA/NifB/PqqE/SkfB family radical SAM enzyme